MDSARFGRISEEQTNKLVVKGCQSRVWSTCKFFWSGPVLAGNNLWAVNSEGKVYRISTGEGAASEFTDLKEPVSLAPVVANNTLYIFDDSGRITAFR